MATAKQMYYEKRGKILAKNLHSRNFEAYYCSTAAQAREKALELIPAGSSVGWGGAASAEEIGLMEAIRSGDFQAFDRAKANTPEEREKIMMDCFGADFFLTGANGLSLDGEMVNIDGNGNRVGAIIYGPKNVLVIAGMNKVMDTLEDAVTRARTVAAPINQQRFQQKFLRKIQNRLQHFIACQSKTVLNKTKIQTNRLIIANTSNHLANRGTIQIVKMLCNGPKVRSSNCSTKQNRGNQCIYR